ncbi:MAG: thiopurine S-methyltransferase [Gammaproteobacteria bacterium]|nr:thiopurine S-methyltransferase [Gammaproteobacteria bacterium]
MDPSFWLARWQAGEIGFHQAEINPHLQLYWPALHAAPGSCVFVPLCGKSRDMLWLAGQGHAVMGVEISPIAVADFFEENALTFTTQADARFVRRRAGEIVLLEGDFFDLSRDLSRDLNRADLDGIAAVYDRASLIALPPSLRGRYAEHMAALLSPGTPVLLITLDYPPQEMDGPPFAVSAAEVETLFASTFHIETLGGQDILAENPRFQARGLTRLQEQVYRLVRC